MRPKHPLLIAIGASAGGSDAIARLLGLLPADLDAIILLVLHRSFDSQSFLRERLAEQTHLRVLEAVEGEQLLAGICYLGQPAEHLTIDALVQANVTPDPERLRRGRTIDDLFASVAEHAGPRAVGIVLSGMLRDGAEGLSAIKRAGGTALVQLPAEAAYPAMPQAAIDQGTAIDLVGSTSELAQAIVALVKGDPLPRIPLTTSDPAFPVISGGATSEPVVIGENIGAIVGIGASAGGIEALEALFRATPAQSGLAFVVVSHLAPGKESALPEILGRFTSMPVLFARQGAVVRPDHVYVGPPGASLTLRKGKLRVRKTSSPEPKPIDVFLTSLANDQEARAIAVILSGSGTDGTLGLSAVKERGGLTVVQGSNSSAPRHAGMPLSAIGTSLVDLVLPVEEIAGKLVAYLRSFDALDGLTVDSPRQAKAEGPAETREAICTILRDQLGHDFSGYKENTFLRRVQRRIQVLQLADAPAYLERLRQDPAEVALLFRDLLIGVTHFFRDKEVFEVLESQVIPRLFDGKKAGDELRIWVPGCSTGEEVYSLAILLREHMDTLRSAPKVQLFGSDIDEAALKTARAARYPAALLEGMTPERLKRFFTADGSSYVLAKQVRDMCLFASHNLIRDPPYSRLHLISCRNLFIYLHGETQARVLPMFHYALRPDGFLFMGSAENVTQHGELFTPVDRKARIYQRRDHSSSALRFTMFGPGPRPPLPLGEPPAELIGAGRTLRRVVEAEVLEHFAPAHVVVNRDGDTVHHSPRISNYLEIPAGQATRQVLAMARKGLRSELRTVLKEVMQSGRSVTRERVAIELSGDQLQFVRLTVTPLSDRHGRGSLFMILFTDLDPPPPATAPAAGSVPPESATVIRNFELEARDHREQLHSTVEEYETAMEELRSSNEELVSLNEELHSTNEELETSKEETQSINEELRSVNHELTHKIEELNQTNADLKNLFDGTGIAILFLNRQLVIRSFTPEAIGLFNLIPTDRGRPLADITSHFDTAPLKSELDSVLATGEPVERQIARSDGQGHYLMRILPYRNNGRVDGAIVAFIDITGIVEAEYRQQTLISELNHRVRNMLNIIAVMARHTAKHSASLADFETRFMGRIQALARAHGLLSREQWGVVALEQSVRQALEPHLLGQEERVTIRGPNVMLQAKAAVSLGMVMHELATNAVKYGALSDTGGVAIEWYAEERDQGRRLVLTWRETGGPPTEPPREKGFGSQLIEREICHSLGGQVSTEFWPEGIEVRLMLPWIDSLIGS